MFSKVLWFDTETFGLDPKVSGIREMAFIKEVGDQVSPAESYKTQPIVHFEDQVYGKYNLIEFCSNYNKKLHPEDPDKLMVFAFTTDEPLFMYSKSSLTFNQEPPHVLDPTDWLLSKDVLPARKVALQLIESLSQHDNIKERWVLAGHNVSFDYEVLYWWAKRILGKDADELLNRINRFVFLDTLHLSRWLQYSGQLPIKNANLSEIARYMQLDVSDMHSAIKDVSVSKSFAAKALGELPLRG